MSAPTILAILGLIFSLGNLYCIFTRRLMSMVYVNTVALICWTAYAIITNQIILTINILLPAPMLYVSWKQVRAMYKEQNADQ